MKRAINSIFLVLGFLPFFILAQTEEYILPTTEEVTTYTISFPPHPIPTIVTVSDAPVAQGCAVLQNYITSIMVFPVEEQTGCSLDRAVGNISVYRMHTTFCLNSACDIGSGTRFDEMQVAETTELQKVCNDPNYQNAVDSDGLDGIDRCYPSSCPDDNVMWSNGNGVSTPTGSICLTNPISGQNCKYNAIENTDGSNSNFTFVQAGEGCSCGNELVPCNPLEDGEITNYPQGQDGCVAMGDSVFCGSDPNIECNNGVCNAGCGYIGDEFMCVESQIDPVETDPCLEGDLRPSCAGVPEGGCPNGVLNCGNGQTDPDTPPEPCQANDPRPECAGLAEGEIPSTGSDGSSSTDLSGLLRQGNENTKAIKDINQKISDELSKEFSPEDLDPASSTAWNEARALLDQITSEGDINASEATFKNDFAPQEGFFNSQLAGLVPVGGSCSNLSMQFTHANVVIDACAYLVHAKVVIEWAMILAFLVYFRNAFTRLKPN